jgi:hypothetical protein
MAENWFKNAGSGILARIAKQYPSIIIWLVFGVVAALSPLIFICVDSLTSPGNAVQKTIAEFLQKGDMLLVTTAIGADIVGRVSQNVISKRATLRQGLLNLSLTIAALSALFVLVSAFEYVNLYGKRNAHAAIDTPYIMHQSWIFLLVTILIGMSAMMTIED